MLQTKVVGSEAFLERASLDLRSSRGLGLAQGKRYSPTTFSPARRATRRLLARQQPEPPVLFPAGPASQPLRLFPGQTRGTQTPSEVFHATSLGGSGRSTLLPWAA